MIHCEAGLLWTRVTHDTSRTYTAPSARFQLPSEDPEISEVSSKCLSILVQLYGGENPESLSPENLVTFANLLMTKEDPKDQKLLLRILKRMVSQPGRATAATASATAPGLGSDLISDFQKCFMCGVGPPLPLRAIIGG